MIFVILRNHVKREEPPSLDRGGFVIGRVYQICLENF